MGFTAEGDETDDFYDKQTKKDEGEKGHRKNSRPNLDARFDEDKVSRTLYDIKSDVSPCPDGIDPATKEYEAKPGWSTLSLDQ
jgi:hypothetical protein